MYFWEKVAKAGGIEDQFKIFLNIKNKITTPICSNDCQGRCCSGTQVREYGYSDDRSIIEINNFITTMTKEIARLNPFYNRGCAYLSCSKCLVEEYKPLVCITYFCSKAAEKLEDYALTQGYRKKREPLISTIKLGLENGLRVIGNNELPPSIKKHKHLDYGLMYYTLELSKYLNRFVPILEEWTKLAFKLPPLVWYDHARQMDSYYESMFYLQRRGWVDIISDPVYQHLVPREWGFES